MPELMTFTQRFPTPKMQNHISRNHSGRQQTTGINNCIFAENNTTGIHHYHSITIKSAVLLMVVVLPF
jgi:hypothetical protein